MYDIIVIGGGPAGLSAACSAYENGAKNILIIERDKELGGILNQCGECPLSGHSLALKVLRIALSIRSTFQ